MKGNFLSTFPMVIYILIIGLILRSRKSSSISIDEIMEITGPDEISMFLILYSNQEIGYDY